MKTIFGFIVTETPMKSCSASQIRQLSELIRNIGFIGRWMQSIRICYKTEGNEVTRNPFAMDWKLEHLYDKAYDKEQSREVQGPVRCNNERWHIEKGDAGMIRKTALWQC